MLQQSTKLGDYGMFKQYTAMIHKEDSVRNLRGLMDFQYPKKGIPIDEVESVDSIVTRLKQVQCPMGLFLRKHMKRLQLQ